MPSLLAALSPDESRVAALVPTPGGGATSIRVQILQSQTATLQTTLLHRRSSTDSSGDAAAAIEKLLFVSDSLVVAAASDLIVVWDLNRGVATSIIQPKHPNEQTFHDVVATGGKLYALVWSSETKKAQIHCYKPETGKLERKIKAGKDKAIGLAVAGHTAVVRQEDAIRILNTHDGQKIAKLTSLKTTTKQVAIVGDTVATIESGEVLLINRTTGKRVGSVACDHASDDMELRAVHNKSLDESLLRLGSKIYSLSKNGAENTLQCRIAAAPSVDARVVLVGQSKSIYALLLKGNQFQMAKATTLSSDDSGEDMVLDWINPASKEQNAAAAKRKKDAIAILGPSQVGGEARGIVDGPVPKKQRAEKNGKDGDDNDVEMQEVSEEKDEGPSIADRLRKLQEAFDAEEDEADEGDGKTGKSNVEFQSKKATTESLTQLLEQALQSSDDVMLELALNVRDNKILQETCEKISDEHLPTLLNALTSRLATKPTRANQLCPWISVLLKTGRIRSVAHLQPLRNLLQERLEVFPSLLKLEGRLGMMTNL